MLTDRFIKSLKPGEKEKFIADYNGLYIRVAPLHQGGSVTFKFKYKKPGSKFPIKKLMGKYLLEFTLDEARELARDYKKDLAKGIDPFKKKQKELEVASDFLEPYRILKGLDKKSKGYTDTVRDVGYLTEDLGDHPPHNYSKVEINSFIRARCQDVKTSTVRKELNLISAVFNLVYEEHEIDHFHRFRKLNIPNLGLDSEDRDDFTSDQLNLVRDIVGGSPNKVDQIIGLLIDTGMRSSEAVGLASRDIKLGTIPHVILHKNPMRPLKTRSSQRIIPLVGSSLAAAKCLDLSEEWIFAKYLKTERGKDSANAAVNKRLHKILGPGSPTSHSFRHTLTTRLRSFECPKDIRKEIGGWASEQSELYGTPGDIKNKAGYIEKALDWVTEIL
jgi:integrase